MVCEKKLSYCISFSDDQVVIAYLQEIRTC